MRGALAALAVTVAAVAGPAAASAASAVVVCRGTVDVRCGEPGSGDRCEVWVHPDPNVGTGVCVLRRH